MTCFRKISKLHEKFLTDKYGIYFDKYFQTLVTCALENVYFFSTWLYTVSLCFVIPLPTTLQNIQLWHNLYIKLFRYSWYLKKTLTLFWHFWNKILRVDLENRTLELLNISKIYSDIYYIWIYIKWTLKNFNTSGNLGL